MPSNKHSQERLENFGRFCLWLVNGYLLGTVVKLYWNALFYAPVNNDAGTFLSLVEKIREGHILFKDYRNGYAPLAFHILAWIREVTPKAWPDYNVYLGTVLLFLLAQGLLVYLTLRHFRISHILCIFAGLWTTLALGRYEGFFIFLEPFVAFFTLLGTWLMLQSQRRVLFIVLAGVSFSLSALSKQYGILALPAVGFYLLYFSNSPKERLTKAALFTVGFVLPLTAFLIYYCVVQGVSVANLFQQLAMNGYANNPNISINHRSMVLKFSRQIGLLLSIAPFFFLVLFSWTKTNVLFLLFSLSLGLSTLVRPFQHYFGLIISFIIIFQIIVFAGLVGRHRIARACLVLYIGWVSFQTIALSQFSFAEQSRLAQYELAHKINSKWPADTESLVYAAPEYMYLARLKQPDDSFAFLANFSGAEQIALIGKSHHILVDTQNFEYFFREKDKVERLGKPFYTVLTENGFKQIDFFYNRFQLWQR
ncbi:MAG: hypothetical protein V4534_02135 [Myxococcota bacterium]